MLAVTLTLITAIYLLGPDLVSRFILGFVVPRRTIQQTKGEEIARAILTAAVPLTIATIWVTKFQIVNWASITPDLQTFFSGIYSEQLFDQSHAHFFEAAATVWRANWSLIWRLYLILIAYSIGTNLLILNYGSVRNSGLFEKHPIARKVLATFVLPRVSEWHILLTNFSHKRTAVIRADILTKSDVLYRGTIEKPFLAPDGSLSGLLVSNPVRFKRDQYIDDKKAGKKPNAEDYWKPIPSQMFLIVAGEISSINLRHSSALGKNTELIKALQKILEKDLTASWQVGKKQG